MLATDLSPNTTFQQSRSKKALPIISKTIDDNFDKSTGIYPNQDNNMDQII